MPIKITAAPKTSNNNSAIARFFLYGAGAVIVGMLAACTGLRLPHAPANPTATTPTTPTTPTASTPRTAPDAANGPVLAQPKSRWVATAWEALPGWEEDNVYEAWNAWLKSCERPAGVWTALCADVRRLSIADAPTQRAWLRERLQPYRVESPMGETQGLLTGYFEPQLEASRSPSNGFSVPLYQAPKDLAQRKPWYSRSEMDTLPQAQAALKDRVIAYLNDPIDALLLQIQGSGRLRISQPDGSARWVRVAFAGTNEQPYRSVGRWLLDQGLVKDASWPGIKAWLAQNPQRQQELLWSNPRVVFFKEETLSELDAAFGPKGAQGVALSAGRSIAVDTGSVPLGTPVWLSSQGAQANFQRLVLAQDTGSAIQGAVRADYFAGRGNDAEELAGRLRQPLQMWVLWPK